jgi:putative glutamine amidotransferase
MVPWQSLCNGAAELNVLPRYYTHSIEEAGGVPLALLNVESPEHAKDLLGRIDGLLFAGGEDPNPLRFGEEPHAGLGPIDIMRDAFEFEMAKAALETEIPIFGICRGVEVITLAVGGTIVQDIVSREGATLKHNQVATGLTATHTVEIAPKSRLAKIIGGTTTQVNSYHHQAPLTAPEGYSITAVSPDGINEAIEFDGERFILGVQWHPEMIYDEEPDAAKLFKAFVEAARDFRNHRR